ncbi:MAG: hypothetical protein LUG60_07750 [Erysipelotrichaceae bacterium]|nr:hypothetical protein [Erysipelotrichaceae bacterium]
MIDCEGAPFITKEFMDNDKVLSKLIIVLINMSAVTVNPFYLLAKEVELIGSRGYTPEDTLLAIETINDDN